MPEPTLTPEQLAELRKYLTHCAENPQLAALATPGQAEARYLLDCIRIREGARVEEGYLRLERIGGQEGYYKGPGITNDPNEAAMQKRTSPLHGYDVAAKRYTFTEPIQPGE